MCADFSLVNRPKRIRFRSRIALYKILLVMFFQSLTPPSLLNKPECPLDCYKRSLSVLYCGDFVFSVLFCAVPTATMSIKYYVKKAEKQTAYHPSCHSEDCFMQLIKKVAITFKENFPFSILQLCLTEHGICKPLIKKNISLFSRIGKFSTM